MTTHHNLDFMRTVAVCLVFVDHATLFANVNTFHGWDLRWLGVYGVYLFFVHTCLVLMWSLERRPHTLDFYVRRIFRIYPLAIITVLTVAAFHLPFYDKARFDRGMVLSNLLLIQNVWVHPNILGTLWSLPLEVQMYLLLPALFVFARRERALWPFLIFWFFACAASNASYGVESGNGLYAVVPHFLPGIMAYIGFKRWAPRLPAYTFIILLLGLLFYFEHRPGIQQGWRVCLILGLSLPFFHDFRNTLLVKISHRIATYSYGIYLLHIFCLQLAFSAFKEQGMLVKMAVTLASLALASWLSYHAVEQPMMKLGSHVANRLQQRFGTDYKTEHGLALN